MNPGTLWQIFAASRSQHWLPLCTLSGSIYDNLDFARWKNVSLHWNSNISKNVSQFSDPELILWLQNREITRGLSNTIFSQGKFAVLYHITFRNLTDAENVFVSGVRFGQKDFLKWLAPQFTFTTEFIYSRQLPWLAAHGGYFAILRWLVAEFHLSKGDVIDVPNVVFQVATKSGRLDILKWLTEYFGLTKSDIGSSILYYASENGHLSILTWLLENFNLAESDRTYAMDVIRSWTIKHGDLEMLQEIMTRRPCRTVMTKLFALAAKYDHFHIYRWLTEQPHIYSHPTNIMSVIEHDRPQMLEWIVDRKKLRKCDILIPGEKVLRVAAKRGSLAIFEWLHFRFGLEKEDLFNEENNVLYYVAKRGHLHIFKWLVQNIGVPKRRLLSCDYNILEEIVCFGHLKLLKWIVKHYKLSRWNILARESVLMHNAVVYGRLPILEWLIEHFNLTRQEVILPSNHTIIECVENHQFSVLKWLGTKFKIRAKDAITHKNYTFSSFNIVWAPLTYEWFAAKFGGKNNTYPPKRRRLADMYISQSKLYCVYFVT